MNTLTEEIELIEPSIIRMECGPGERLPSIPAQVAAGYRRFLRRRGLNDDVFNFGFRQRLNAGVAEARAKKRDDV